MPSIQRRIGKTLGDHMVDQGAQERLPIAFDVSRRKIGFAVQPDLGPGQNLEELVQ